MIRLVWTGACALALLIGSASDLRAAFYGSEFSSPTGDVTFRDVQDVNGLYGAPTVSGNSLDFSPNAFEVECNTTTPCPSAPNEADDTLTFQIDADAGFFIEQIELSESGDTLLVDSLLGGGSAVTTVVGDVFVDVLEVNGAPINGINGAGVMVFTSDGDYRSDEEGFGLHLWSGELLLNIDALIVGAGQTGQATLVELSLANTLTAFAADGATSRIEKKDIDGLAITVIPEPGTALLLGLGLLGLARFERRTAH